MKIYTERGLVNAGEWHIPMLNPFWGRTAVSAYWPQFADRYVEVANELFELSDLQSADLAVYPVDWKRVRNDPERIERAREFTLKAKALGKPTVFFYSADQDDALTVDASFIFRTSMIRSRRRAGEFTLPGFFEDLLEYVDGELPVRTKSPGPPIVSFCGFALFEDRPASWREALRGRAVHAKRLVFERLGRPTLQDVYVRARALEALLHQRRYVRPELIIRSQGGGGGWSDDLAPAFRPWGEVRREYVRSIVDSDYVLCTRGIGNFSYRLYETLCLGRIPVFIDTDCVLPYDFAINWRDYAVWLKRSEISTIGERVAAFHESLSDADFVERQHACRKLWDEYLSPHGYFSQFHRHFSATD